MNMFRSTTQTDKDVLIEMAAKLLQRNRQELKLWDSLADTPINGYSLDGYGGSEADMKQQMRLMRVIVRKVELLDKIEPLTPTA